MILVALQAGFKMGNMVSGDQAGQACDRYTLYHRQDLFLCLQMAECLPWALLRMMIMEKVDAGHIQVFSLDVELVCKFFNAFTIKIYRTSYFTFNNIRMDNISAIFFRSYCRSLGKRFQSAVLLFLRLFPEPCCNIEPWFSPSRGASRRWDG